MIIPARQIWYAVGLELSVDSYKDASTFAGRGRPARLGREGLSLVHRLPPQARQAICKFVQVRIGC